MSRNILFSSARISKSKMVNVDRRRIPSNAECQDDVQCISGGNGLQEFIDNSDLLISN